MGTDPSPAPRQGYFCTVARLKRKQLVEKGFDPSFVRKVTKQMSVAAGVTGGNAADSGKESVADRLVELALARFRIGRSETDEAFAVERGGPNIAIMFRGSRESLRSKMAPMYRQEYGRVPYLNAVADAMNVLQGEALGADQEQTYTFALQMMARTSSST